MIKLTRIDHRLLHGQVAFTWIKYLGADCILIANDAVVKDQLRIAALRMAQPDGVKMVIKSLDDSIRALNSGVTDKYKLIILLENTTDACKLATAVPIIKKVNLGGAKMAEGKHQISKAFFVSNDEVQKLKQLHDTGVALEVQMTPEEPAKNVMDLL